MPSGVLCGDPGPPTGADPSQVSFCVEKPRMPMWARRLGRVAGKPKQSGSMYSALVLPNSRSKNRLP